MSCSIYLTFLKGNPLSKDCMHQGSDLVPFTAIYFYKRMQVCVLSYMHKKDLRLNWVSVLLWQQFLRWRWAHMVHRKETRTTIEKLHLVFSQTQPWKKDKQSKLLGSCLLHYFVLLDATVNCFALSLMVLDWHTTSPPHPERSYGQMDQDQVIIHPTHIISPLCPTFPFLWSSFPLAGQDHSTSDRHIIRQANQRLWLGFASQQPFRTIHLSLILLLVLWTAVDSRAHLKQGMIGLQAYTVLGPIW